MVEEQYIVAEAIYNILQALTYLESVQRRARPHVLPLQALQHLLLLTMLHECEHALIGRLSYELVSVAAFLKEDLEDGVEARLHRTLQRYKHLLQSNQADTTDGRAQRFR